MDHRTSPSSPVAPGGPPVDPLAAAAKAHAAFDRLLTQIHRVIVGQDGVIEQLLVALFARGHVLLIGVPGLAKTLLVSTVAKAVDLRFGRIQFTPDLMPSDITGTNILQEDPISRQRSFVFLRGPLFANVILADEINRTPPKTQAALLQAMQENQITASGETFSLPAPFWVLATQNPIEQEGTYPLPEAQLDRFFFSVVVQYPTMDEEVTMVLQTTSDRAPEVTPVLTGEEILALQQLVRGVVVDERVVRGAVRLVAATRPGSAAAPDFMSRYVRWGAGPRASQALILGAKARALLKGRVHVDWEDVLAIAQPVLRHRILPNFLAQSDGRSADDLIAELIRQNPRP